MPEHATSDLEQRAAAHAALGEPVRLALFDRLIHSDSTPSELAEAFDLTSNLLAHHLGVLERAGLVERVVSSGDRRRRYLRVRHGMLALLGPVAPTTHRVPAGRPLFLCTHNSARSQLAAAIWWARTGTPAASAGTDPAPRVHPEAQRAARRRALDLGDAEPRRLEPGDLEQAAVVITVCDRAREEIDLPDTALHWSIPDPVADGTRAAFDEAADRLEGRIEHLLGTAPPAVPPSISSHQKGYRP